MYFWILLLEYLVSGWNDFLNEASNVFELGVWGAVREAAVRVEFNVLHECFEEGSSHLAPLERHDGVAVAVSLEDLKSTYPPLIIM